jgi:hypothetical protein
MCNISENLSVLASFGNSHTNFIYVTKTSVSYDASSCNTYTVTLPNRTLWT